LIITYHRASHDSFNLVLKKFQYRSDVALVEEC